MAVRYLSELDGSPFNVKVDRRQYSFVFSARAIEVLVGGSYGKRLPTPHMARAIMQDTWIASLDWKYLARDEQAWGRAWDLAYEEPDVMAR